MPTRNVVLTEQQETFVKQMVSSGRYQNVSEVLREGIRLIQRQEEKYEAQLTELREAAKIGIADIDSGNFQCFDAPEQLNRHLEELARDAIGEHSLQVEFALLA